MSDGGVSAPVADLLDAPGGRRIRQALKGAQVAVLASDADYRRVRTESGYEGWIAGNDLADAVAVTHRVAVFASYAFPAPDIKSMGPRPAPLSFGVKLRVTDERPAFFETDAGFVPKRHLRPLDRPFADPANIAQLHFNVPYLWGGNSTAGIDCSGLVQAALLACDMACPGDSGAQREALGDDVPLDAPLRRGDLVFWQGHVGMMVDAETLIHANAHHMAVAYEPFAAARARIAAKEFGEIVAIRRLG